MTDDSFGGLVRGLKVRRGACPEVAELVGLRLGELGAASERKFERHLRLCPRCRELYETTAAEPVEMDDPSWQRVARRLDGRPSPWHRSAGSRSGRQVAWLTAAAVLILGIGLFWTARPGLGPERRVSVERGAAIDLAAPAGLVERVDVFSWLAPPMVAVYRLELRRGESVVFDGEVPEDGWRPAESLRDALQPQVVYRWRVTAVDESGRVVAGSDWLEFRLAP